LTHAFFEQYANQIFRYCLHQLGSREEAEDAVQSTFLNAFRGLKRGVVPELESAWLFKIAHNVCLSRRRSTWRRGRIESPADFELVEELTPAPAQRADELIGLQDVLEQMPENQRRAILLREWQGLSYREIAAELELSQTAVETLIFRARRALAAGLEQPPASQRRRALRAADWGNVVAALKSLLIGGAAAAKVAATVAVVGAGAAAVVATAPLHARPAKAGSALSNAQAASGAARRRAASPAGTSRPLRPLQARHGAAVPAHGRHNSAMSVHAARGSLVSGAALALGGAGGSEHSRQSSTSSPGKAPAVVKPARSSNAHGARSRRGAKRPHARVRAEVTPVQSTAQSNPTQANPTQPKPAQPTQTQPTQTQPTQSNPTQTQSSQNHSSHAAPAGSGGKHGTTP
jgi:RNA polymerase sigma factor (sigma-70 family)